MDGITPINHEWHRALGGLVSLARERLTIAAPFITLQAARSITAFASPDLREHGRLDIVTDLSPAHVCDGALEPTADAVNYANQVTDTSRYYVILLDGADIQQIASDRARIVDILNAKARRVFARKEIGAITIRVDATVPVSSSQAQPDGEIANDVENLY